jgi:hypothetical protein
MPSAEKWRQGNASGRSDGPGYRRILAEGWLCAGAIVIRHGREERVAQASFTENHSAIKAFASDRADQPFGVSILP